MMFVARDGEYFRHKALRLHDLAFLVLRCHRLKTLLMQCRGIDG